MSAIRPPSPARAPVSPPDASTPPEATAAGDVFLPPPQPGQACSVQVPRQHEGTGLPHLLAHPLAQPRAAPPSPAGRLLARLGDHLPALPAEALARLTALPEAEHEAWLAQVQGSRQPQALLQTFAALRTAEGRAEVLLADQLLADVSPPACQAAAKALAGLRPDQRAPAMEELRQIFALFRVPGQEARALLEALSRPVPAVRTVMLPAVRMLIPLLLRPTRKRRTLQHVLCTQRELPMNPAHYAMRWHRCEHFLAALGQIMFWMCDHRSWPTLLTEVTATEPWERHRQTQARIASLAALPLTDLAVPEAVQAASARGDRTLTTLLADRANLPPHVRYTLRENAAASRHWQMTETEAVRGAIDAWPGWGPLPNLVVQRLRRDHLPLTSDTLAELFAFCDSFALPEARATPLRIAALDALDARELEPSAKLKHGPFTCVVCDTEASAHTHLGGCACPPALCDGCAAEAVTRVGDRLTCVTACPEPLNREYLERLGVAPAVLQQRLIALHRDRLQRVPEWTLDSDGLGGHYEPPPPVAPDAIPAIRPGQDPHTLRLLLSGLAAWPNYNGDGVHRECYECAQPVQKGEACLHMHCRGARPHDWDFERGPYNQQPRFATAGLEAQGYIPLTRGPLARAGFYAGLPVGVASDATLQRVQRRREAWLTQLGGVLPPQEDPREEEEEA